MGAIRQSRSVRKREGASLRLQERDRWILDALGKCRFLTTGQLARLFFGSSTSAANKRLRRLLDAGLVNVWIRRLDEQNIYSVTPGGAKQSGNAKQYGTLPRGLDQIEHVQLLNDIRIAFSLGLDQLNGSLCWWRSDWELRIPCRPLIPDATFAVRWADHTEITFLLEADNMMRSQQAFVRKVLRYVKGGMNELTNHSAFRGVLVVARDQGWADRYRAVAVNAGTPLSFWFTTISSLQKDFPGPIWRSIVDDKSYSLRHMIYRLYGKEVTYPKNPSGHESYINE